VVQEDKKPNYSGWLQWDKQTALAMKDSKNIEEVKRAYFKLG
jgi:hypothetical protein